MARAYLVAFAGLLVIMPLTGCSSGKSMQGAESPHSVVDWPIPESARSVIGGESLDMTSGQIKAKADGLRENANAVVVSDLFFVQPDGTTFGITPDCTGVTCTVPGLGAWSLHDEVNFEYRPVMRHQGVDLVASRERVSGEMAADNVGYWGSLDFSGFGLDASKYDMGGGDFNSLSFGRASGTNPGAELGTAAWAGVVMAVESGEDLASGAVYQGDAAVTVDLASDAPSVSVAFTNMTNLQTPTLSVEGMDWNGLALADGGAPAAAMATGFKVPSTAPGMRKRAALSNAVDWLAPSGPRGSGTRTQLAAGMDSVVPPVDEDKVRVASRL